MDRAGKKEDYITGITMPIDVAWSPGGSLHWLEFGSGLTDDVPPRIAPNSGRVLRLTEGDHEEVVADLNFPFSMAFGPEDDLWITVDSSFAGVGGGRLLRLSNVGALP